jgi:hypothetical protein
MNDNSQPDPERQFLDLTEGDVGLAKLLHASLQRLRDGVAGDDLREMARDVLDGRTDLRQVAASEAYGPALTGHFHRFKEWEQGLDPEERERLATAAADAVSDLDQSG